MAAAEAGFKERRRPHALGVGLPEGVVAVGPEPSDARLATPSALDHALQGLQPVEVIAIDAATADADSFFDLGTERHVERGGAPSNGQRRTGHKGEIEFARNIVHLLAPVPVPGKVLVVEYGRALAGSAIDRGDLFEKLVARVEVLALFVVAVAAVLADEQDAVDGQIGSVQRQGVGDGGVDRHVGKAGRSILAQIAFGTLIHVQRDQIHGRVVVPAVPAVAFEEAVADVLGVGVLAVLGDDAGDFGAVGHDVSPSTGGGVSGVGEGR